MFRNVTQICVRITQTSCRMHRFLTYTADSNGDCSPVLLLLPWYTWRMYSICQHSVRSFSLCESNLCPVLRFLNVLITFRCQLNLMAMTAYSGYGVEGSRDWTPVGARFSVPVQTGSEDLPTSCMSIRSPARGESGRGLVLTTRRLLASRLCLDRAIHLTLPCASRTCYSAGLLNLICGAGNFDIFWSAYGQHKIQHTLQRMNKYMYNYL